MKHAALVLALFVIIAQSVVAADCCCVIVCQHHSEVCSKCTHEGALNAGAPTHCCGTQREGAPAPSEKRCTHLEPSSEVVVQAVDACTAPPVLTLDVPLVPVPAPLEADKAAVQVCTTRGSPPLHLLFSVLRV
jgi:hypothetical protein